MLTTLPGNLAWGFVVGLGMINSGMTVFQSSGFNLLVYSGSAQMVAMPLMAAGISVTLVLVACFMACIRFILYSAALAPLLHHLPLKKRMFISAFSIDAAVGIFLSKRAAGIKDQSPFSHRVTYLWGMNVYIWSCWVVGVFAGIFAAGALPASEKFSYLGVVALLGITVAMMHSRATVVCAIASAVVALLTQNWPYKLGLLAAILVGMALGFSMDRNRAIKS